jgi:hypothetical protein
MAFLTLSELEFTTNDICVVDDEDHFSQPVHNKDKVPKTIDEVTRLPNQYVIFCGTKGFRMQYIQVLLKIPTYILRIWLCVLHFDGRTQYVSFDIPSTPIYTTLLLIGISPDGQTVYGHGTYDIAHEYNRQRENEVQEKVYDERRSQLDLNDGYDPFKN